jgi:hypothetical protein
VAFGLLGRALAWDLLVLIFSPVKANGEKVAIFGNCLKSSHFVQLAKFYTVCQNGSP